MVLSFFFLKVGVHYVLNGFRCTRLPFTVVFFPEFILTSEVPSSWLLENETQCWWPKDKKHISRYIQKSVTPDETKFSLLHVDLDAHNDNSFIKHYYYRFTTKGTQKDSGSRIYICCY